MDGADRTDAYRRGAAEALRVAALFDCRAALLKARSPACGSGEVYDFALPNMLDIVTYQVGDAITFTYVEGDPVSTAQSIGGEETTQDEASTAPDAAQDATGETDGEPSGQTA